MFRLLRVKPPTPQIRIIVGTKNNYQPRPSLIPYRHWLWFCNAKRDPYCNSSTKIVRHKNCKTICTISLEIYAWRWPIRVETCNKVNIYVILKISKYIILLFRRKKIYCRFTINRVVTLVLPLNSLHFILHMPHHPLHSHCRKLLFDLCRTKSLAKVKFQHKAVNFPAYIFTQRTSLVSA